MWYTLLWQWAIATLAVGFLCTWVAERHKSMRNKVAYDYFESIEKGNAGRRELKYKSRNGGCYYRNNRDAEKEKNPNLACLIILAIVAGLNGIVAVYMWNFWHIAYFSDDFLGGKTPFLGVIARWLFYFDWFKELIYIIFGALIGGVIFFATRAVSLITAVPLARLSTELFGVPKEKEREILKQFWKGRERCEKCGGVLVKEYNQQERYDGGYSYTTEKCTECGSRFGGRIKTKAELNSEFINTFTNVLNSHIASEKKKEKEENERFLRDLKRQYGTGTSSSSGGYDRETSEILRKGEAADRYFKERDSMTNHSGWTEHDH